MFKNEQELYFTIGKNVKLLRKKSNITQKELCEQVGISLSYLSKIESQKCYKSISLSTLNIIANHLCVDIKVFFEKGNNYYG